MNNHDTIMRVGRQMTYNFRYGDFDAIGSPFRSCSHQERADLAFAYRVGSGSFINNW